MRPDRPDGGQDQTGDNGHYQRGSRTVTHQPVPVISIVAGCLGEQDIADERPVHAHDHVGHP
jgi:hypothetical protein